MREQGNDAVCNNYHGSNHFLNFLRAIIIYGKKPVLIILYSRIGKNLRET